MKAQDYKDIKTSNADTVKVMANNEVWWQKNLWHPITVYHFTGSSSTSLHSSDFEKYAPFKVIKLKFSKESIQRYGKPTLFFEGRNSNGKLERAYIRYSYDYTEVTIDFNFTTKELGATDLRFEERLSVLKYTNDDVNEVIDLKMYVVE